MYFRQNWRDLCLVLVGRLRGTSAPLEASPVPASSNKPNTMMCLIIVCHAYLLYITRFLTLHEYGLSAFQRIPWQQLGRSLPSLLVAFPTAFFQLFPSPLRFHTINSNRDRNAAILQQSKTAHQNPRRGRSLGVSRTKTGYSKTFTVIMAPT